MSYTPFMYLCRRILCLNVCTVITLFCGITQHKGKRESLSLLLWNVSRWFNAFIWLMWKMSCSKTFFNLRIKTLDKKGTSILNKACCGRFEILKTYISRSITHTVHIWKMILRISAYDLKKLMVLYNRITRNEFRQLYNYNTRCPNDIFALNIIIFLEFRDILGSHIINTSNLTIYYSLLQQKLVFDFSYHWI